MITLNDQPATLKFTPRVERHGEDNAPGCTLNMSIKGSNELLNLLDEDLRKTLYKAKPKEDQDIVDQASDEDYPSVLRFPYMGKIPWGYETAGYRVAIGGGLDEESDLHFIQCEIKKFSIACEQGGTVTITFNINCSPTPQEAGELYELNGQIVNVTLTPPSAEEQAQMELDGQDDGHDYGHVSQADTDTSFADEAEKKLQEAFAGDDAA